MKNSIRWLLTESRISNLNPQKVNFINGKLICYHLTSHQRWASYNPSIDEKLRNPIIKHPKQERSADDSRAMRIVKNLKDSERISRRDSYDIEEEVIMDMIDDPYTDTNISTINLSEVINPNDNVWYNYLLEEIRTKTNSGKTKKAEKLFKELDTLMAQKNVNQEISEPELDLSHRKIFGNSLKEVYRF